MRYVYLTAAVLVAIVVVAVVAFGNRINESEDQAVNPLSPDGPAHVRPGEIAETPERWFRHSVVVRGTVGPVGPEGSFALTGPEGAILVRPEPGVEDDVARGERVSVSGIVDRVSRAQAADTRDLGDVETDTGAPFVSAEHLTIGS